MSGGGSERGSSFYWGFLFLSAGRRRALRSVYAFCRLMDDIVDSGTLTEAEARRMLGFWREEIRRLYAGRPTHSLSQEILPHIRTYSLPQQPFLDLIGGVEMDLSKKRYETFEELEPYLHGVAAAVGQLCVEIFGHRHSAPEQMREYAKNMGYAFQLTNILRDVGADLEQGRVYLPLREMEAAGYSLEALARREHTPAFRTLMNRLYERAKTHYRRARNDPHPLDRASMTPAEVMARVYEALLDEIKAEDFRVLFRRASLPWWRKARLAASAWAASHGYF